MLFSFGTSEHERIEVDVLGYERVASGNYWDDNWLNVEVRVRAGGSRFKAAPTFTTTELTDFLAQLRSLHEQSRGFAEFDAMEQQLNLRLEADGKGHIELRGEVADGPGLVNRLQFTLHFDQSQLGASIRELERVISQFPIRSS